MNYANFWRKRDRIGFWKYLFYFQSWPTVEDCATESPDKVHYMRKKHLTEITVLCINALIECFKKFEHFYGRFDEQALFHLMCKSFLEVILI